VSVMMRKDAVMRCGGYMHASSSSSSPSSSSSSGAGAGKCGDDVTGLQVAHVEDYDLWLRLVGLLPSPSSGAAATCGGVGGGGGGRDDGEYYEIYNTGDVLLLLRKHAHNVSARNAQVPKPYTRTLTHAP
jgi:hypothetical protein